MPLLLPKRIVLASGNRGKAREFNLLLQEIGGADVELLLQSELNIEPVEETGLTFSDNALLKARHAATLSGLPALADDSGIEVDALHGAPGVRSARYAGEGASDQDNVSKLLADLEGIPEARRTARFRCVLALVRRGDDPNPVLASGSWEGHIALQPRGAGGFGYDPVFIDGGSGRTAAELTPDEKNARSHRGNALAHLRTVLSAKL
jgi:XTP/dITP diphosphohydrolase